jgi:hypothetical protein
MKPGWLLGSASLDNFVCPPMRGSFRTIRHNRFYPWLEACFIKTTAGYFYGVVLVYLQSNQLWFLVIPYLLFYALVRRGLVYRWFLVT